jgi:hypothetical protein
MGSLGAERSGLSGLRLGDLFLDLQRLGRQLRVLRLGEEGVEPATVIDRPQRGVGDAQLEAAVQ